VAVGGNERADRRRKMRERGKGGSSWCTVDDENFP